MAVRATAVNDYLTGPTVGSTIRDMSRPSRRALLGALAAGVVCLVRPLGASNQPATERVRVPTRHANVHKGPNTTTEVLVLVPLDTVLTVLARDKEWVQVRLTPELRKTGMVMRWYKEEDRGWMHDSTVVPAR
jgi:hypothetical protein